MRLFVDLTRDELERLAVQAKAARRRPQDQAAVLISQALKSERDGTSTTRREVTAKEERHVEPKHAA